MQDSDISYLVEKNYFYRVGHEFAYTFFDRTENALAHSKKLFETKIFKFNKENCLIFFIYFIKFLEILTR